MNDDFYSIPGAYRVEPIVGEVENREDDDRLFVSKLVTIPAAVVLSASLFFGVAAASDAPATTWSSVHSHAVDLDYKVYHLSDEAAHRLAELRETTRPSAAFAEYLADV